jgi:hypothetical protein
MNPVNGPGWHENSRPRPDARALDAAAGSTMTAAFGSSGEQHDTGSQHGPASAHDLRGATKVLREDTE